MTSILKPGLLSGAMNSPQKTPSRLAGGAIGMTQPRQQPLTQPRDTGMVQPPTTGLQQQRLSRLAGGVAGLPQTQSRGVGMAQQQAQRDMQQKLAQEKMAMARADELAVQKGQQQQQQQQNPMNAQIRNGLI